MTLFITTDTVGGVWRYAVDLARGVPGATLALMGPPPSLAQLEEARGLNIVQTGLPLDWTAETPGDLAEASAILARMAEGASSIHLHAPALVGRVQWPAPVIAVAHSCVGTWWEAVRGGALPPDLAWRADLTGDGLRRATIIAPTRAHADALNRVYGYAHAEIVHNGGGLSVTPGARAGVLTAGRLWDEGKGAAWLDRAALELPIRAAGPIRGPNGVTQSFGHLTLLGTLDAPAMARAYASAQVFASMAVYEPFGLAVLEAASAGCAIVLRDIPSARELWDGAALFVQKEPDLLPALRRAVGDPSLGPAAAARARRYTIAATTRRTLATHANVCVLT